MDIKGLVATALNRLGFLDAYSFLRRKLTRSQVAILIYHRVCPDRDSWSLEPLSPQEFQKQIEYFCRNYELLSLDQLVSYIRQRKTLPEKAVVITFDDGYKDNYRYAYPLLKKYRIPATIFLATGCIGKDRLFWWDKVGYIIENSTVARLNLDELGSYSLRSNTDRHQAKFIISERLKNLPDGRKNVLIEKLTNICQVSIPPGLGKEFVLSWNEVREMSDDGISFGAHSVNHPILTNMPFERAKWEIVQSKKDIEERLGIQVTTFAYPNGNYDSKLHQFLKECGFTCAVSVLPRKLIGLKDDPYSLSRIPAMEDSNKMKGMFCGLWGDLQGMLS